MTYDEARTAIDNLNRRIRAVEDTAPRNSAPVKDLIAWQTARDALIKEGRAAGFIRIFNGSFKLNLSKFDTEAAA